VEVTGAVPDIRRELRRAAVYVAPMVSGTGLKNKVLEAMAAGLPVVGTPLALEGIGEGNGVISARDASDIAEKVLRLLGDRAALVSAGRQARDRVVMEFTWERSARGIEDLWYEVAR
jgi:glycosyltransferase involved in cell wall biosynthesis